MEWLTKDHSSSPQIEIIRKKLASALSQAQQFDNPLQDAEDDDDIENLLGSNPEYQKEIMDIQRNKPELANNSSVIIHGSDNGDDSDGTTKINNSDDEDIEIDTDDSMDSAGRAEIEEFRRNSKLKLQRSESQKSKGKGKSKKSKKSKKNKYEDDLDMDINDMDDIQGLEQQQMLAQMEQMKTKHVHQLTKFASGVNVFKPENQDKWNQDMMKAEMDEMKEHHRRLSNASLSVQDVEAKALATMAEIQQGSATTTPIGDLLNNGNFNAFPDTVNKVSMKPSMTTDTVDVPSTIGSDYGLVTLGNEPQLDNKSLPPKSPPLATSDRISSPSNISASSKPIQEINNAGSPLHVTSAEPVMIGGNSANNSRRNSVSYSREHSMSYSHHSQQGYYGGGQNGANGGYNNNNNNGYGVVDISDVVAPATQPHRGSNAMQQGLLSNNNNSNITNRDGNLNNKNPLVRLFRWYISPMHSRDTLHRLWYHGANAVLSTIICFIMLTLFILAIAFIPFCGIGLIFVYFMCLLARHFAVIDSTFSCYFFGNKIFPRFSMGINKSHKESIIGELKDYMSDPHMLEVILYFTFVKLPAAFILSGVTMALFSYVTATLLSPLIYYLDPAYFEDGLYCLFGSYSDTEQKCQGWAITSFGETFVAFLAFIPALPLTLHLSNFSAKLLCRVTLNFLSTSSSSGSNGYSKAGSTSSSPRKYSNNGMMNNGYNGYNQHSANIMMNGAGYR